MCTVQFSKRNKIGILKKWNKKKKLDWSKSRKEKTGQIKF